MNITDETNYNIIQGDSFTLDISYVDDLNNPVDITSFDILFQVKDRQGSHILIAECTPGDGIIDIDAVNGKFVLFISSEKTKKFAIPRSVYQLQINNSSGTATTLLQGWFTVDPGVID